MSEGTLVCVRRQALKGIHSRTNMPMHLDGHHMLQFARVFMQLKLTQGVYLIFIWFVLTLRPALKVSPHCCLPLRSLIGADLHRGG